MSALLYSTVPFKRQIFKRKKGSVNISLGLNYCSLCSSRPPSCDTVHFTISFNANTFFEGIHSSFFIHEGNHVQIWGSKVNLELTIKKNRNDFAFCKTKIYIYSTPLIKTVVVNFKHSDSYRILITDSFKPKISVLKCIDDSYTYI
jgi:hypothetical protein